MNTPTQESPPVITYQERDYITATDAASYLGVHYTTILNLIKYHSRLESVKLGAGLFVTVDSVDAEKKRRAADASAAQEVA